MQLSFYYFLPSGMFSLWQSHQPLSLENAWIIVCYKVFLNWLCLCPHCVPASLCLHDLKLNFHGQLPATGSVVYLKRLLSGVGSQYEKITFLCAWKIWVYVWYSNQSCLLTIECRPFLPNWFSSQGDRSNCFIHKWSLICTTFWIL